MKNILITGGAGFIGSNFVLHFLEKYPQYNIINLDALTYASSFEVISHLQPSDRYTFVKGDLRDKTLIHDIFKEHHITDVIHFAAESHVDNSIANPEVFLETNIMGTFNLLHAAYSQWMKSPHKAKEEFQGSRFHHISTDEVYGTLGEEGLFREDTSYAPNSPYSASKASSDFIVRSFRETYGLDTVVTNCSNNYGPHQHSEKLIPKVIENALNWKSIPVYGTGKNIRDWLYVLDHCKGIDLAFHKGVSGEHYNIGGRNERTNNYIVNKICMVLDKKRPHALGNSYRELITYVEDRAGHDMRYAIDATKIENELGWKAEENFESGIEKTIDWYLEKHDLRFAEKSCVQSPVSSIIEAWKVVG